MPHAKVGTIVKVHLTAMLKGGKVLYSTIGGDPLVLTIGQRKVMPAVEEAIEGMSPGETKRVTIPAAKAYGRRDPTKVTKFGEPHPHLGPAPGVMHKDIVTLERGKQVTLLVADGQDRLILDENSPLAGEDLVFNIELEEIVS